MKKEKKEKKGCQIGPRPNSLKKNLMSKISALLGLSRILFWYFKFYKAISGYCSQFIPPARNILVFMTFSRGIK